MSRALFGTDGVRGRANQHPMTPELCLALGRAVTVWARRAGAEPPRVVLARDTRASGPMLGAALMAGVQSAGGETLIGGVLPTPAVAWLTRDLGAQAGLVVSASHNPYWDNGVKVFGGDGFKLTDAEEALLAELTLNEDLAEEARVDAEQLVAPTWLHDGAARYAAALQASFPAGLDLRGLRLLVDCAHGAAYQVAPRVFTALGATVVPIGTEPNGHNINVDVGATAPGEAARRVRAGHAELGVVFDGDADRLILIDETGDPVDGDEVLAIAAFALQARGALRGPVVATVMSNLGLEVALRERGLDLLRTDVGDRYVVQAMRANGCNLGGEQSGHVVCFEVATTGDGIATALLLLAELRRSGRPLSELRRQMTRFPQTLVNVRVASKPPLASLISVSAAIARAEAALGERGRVLVRYSGTEPKARVMVEGEDLALVQPFAEQIAEALVAALGPPRNEPCESQSPERH